MLPDEGWFPLLAQGRHFRAIYQRGILNRVTSVWQRSSSGSEYLVVCSCGRGTYGYDLDEAIGDLRKSCILYQDGSHSHDTTTFACNIIEGTKEGEAGFIWGKIVVPELVADLNLGKPR